MDKPEYEKEDADFWRKMDPPTGYVSVKPKRNEVQVDVDDFPQFILRWKRLEAILRKRWGLKDLVMRPSRSPGNWHATVTLGRNVTVREQIALAACLGSDPMRELICLIRFENDIEQPIQFFQKEPSNGGS